MGRNGLATPEPMAELSLSVKPGFDWKSGRPPFRKTIFEPPSLKTLRPQCGHGLVRQHAIGTAAVGDDLQRPIKVGEPSLKLAERNVHSSARLRLGSPTLIGLW